jgi:hypothetical protein
MANFTTHIAVGTVVSGALATLTLAADVVDQQSLVAVTLAGVVGSILPDIDLKDSRPSRALFSGLAVFFSFAVLFSCASRYSIAELWILWLGTLVGVRYGVHAVFHQIAIHRGIWHSILATVFCALVTAIVFKYLMGFHEGIAWLGAGFLAIGYLTHLVLDELYSVDVMDTRIKASFGTALKLADLNNWRHSVAMAVATAGLVMIAPPTGAFINGLSSQKMWASLEDRLLPKQAWFGVIDIDRPGATQQASTAPASGASNPTASVSASASAPAPAQVAAPAATASPLTTGSLPARSPFKTIATEAGGGEAPANK